MKKNAGKNIYTEPSDYFPKELRKKHKLGEFAETKDKKATPAKKKVKRSK